MARMIIGGKFEQKFTGTDTGGIVLIAGEQLEFTPMADWSLNRSLEILLPIELYPNLH